MEPTAQEWLEMDLAKNLEATRQHPGLSIEKVAHVIKVHFAPVEIEALVKHLKETRDEI